MGKMTIGVSYKDYSLVSLWAASDGVSRKEILRRLIHKEAEARGKQEYARLRIKHAKFLKQLT
jgi:hypothetical protein